MSAAPEAAAARIKEQTVTGILWMGGARLATQVIDQAFTIFLVRLLAPADFGLIAMAAVFTSLFNLFTDIGINPALVQRANVEEEHLSSAFWGNLSGGVILCGLAVLCGPFIAGYYRTPTLGPVFAALSVRFIFAGANATQEALLSRELRFSTITVRNITSASLGGAIGLGMALGGAGVWSLVAQTLSTHCVRTLVLWYATPWRPKRRFSWMKFRELWSFGSRMLAGQILGYAVRQSDNFLVGKTLGPTFLGYYAFGYGMFLAPLNNISLIVGRVTFSAFSRLQDDAARLQRGFMLGVRYVSFFAFPALFGLFLIAPDLVPAVFGPKWTPAILVMRLLLVAGALQSHANLWTSVLAATGRPHWVLRWAALSAALYIPSFYVGLRWGIVGVAAAYTSVTIVLVPIQFALVQHLIGFRARQYFREIAAVLFASAVMGVSVLLVQLWLSSPGVSAGMRLLAALVVGPSSYLLAVILIERDLVFGLTRLARGARRPHLAKEPA